MTPSLDLANLLKRLTKLRETFFSLDYQFIMKGYNSVTSLRKRCMGQGMWEGVQSSRHYLVMEPSHVHLHVFTNLEVLQTSLSRILMEDALHRSIN